MQNCGITLKRFSYVLHSRKSLNLSNFKVLITSTHTLSIIHQTKGHVTRCNFSCNLQCNIFKNKYCKLQWHVRRECNLFCDLQSRASMNSCLSFFAQLSPLFHRQGQFFTASKMAILSKSVNFVVFAWSFAGSFSFFLLLRSWFDRSSTISPPFWIAKNSSWSQAMQLSDWLSIARQVADGGVRRCNLSRSIAKSRSRSNFTVYHGL